ncbi:c-type cytochrome biogenesis protein CcmI [Alkalimarinus sediminis]|uniref:C-type cytochrome biogenesis protein CcmI n=1 Tax=Alkalimarinus sediminis TaxID=1632866 RepID=A0A9E8HVS1_9ALTE|nr:c-type cytochrome biogenesis protein CcmI [Alkalimarinus sediminis]UZW76709.1 c-type cytochrome biogenesis protein CcmI [Alkalimarinus sediminis]
MSDFWVISVVLVVLALGFVLYPVVRAHRAKSNEGSVEALDRRSQNIAFFKDRLEEINAEKEAGNLSDEQFEQLKSELEAGLITDVDGLSHDAESAAKSMKVSVAAWSMTGIMLLSIPIVSYALYAKWGALDGVEQYREWGNSVPAISEGMPKQNIDELLVALREKLEANPDNPDGWFMLARSSMNLEKYDQASYAFLRMAELLEKEQEDASAIYGLAAQALFFAEQGQMTDKVKSILDKAFATNPDETNGLGLLGISAFEQGQYEDAIKYWGRILEVEPDNPSRDAIVAGINKARAALGLPLPVDKYSEAPLESNSEAVQGQTTDDPNEQSNTSSSVGADVKVLVELDASLASEVSPDDIIFIFARAVNGSPMPLAASRQTVSSLPILVTLNDEMAMGPMAKISSAEEVSIIARVSKSGQPGAMPGDLQGGMSPVKVGSGEVVKVVINEKVN